MVADPEERDPGHIAQQPRQCVLFEPITTMQASVPTALLLVHESKDCNRTSARRTFIPVHSRQVAVQLGPLQAAPHALQHGGCEGAEGPQVQLQPHTATPCQAHSDPVTTCVCESSWEQLWR